MNPVRVPLEFHWRGISRGSSPPVNHRNLLSDKNSGRQDLNLRLPAPKPSHLTH